jgi:hypothetical protein
MCRSGNVAVENPEAGAGSLPRRKNCEGARLRLGERGMARSGEAGDRFFNPVRLARSLRPLP